MNNEIKQLIALQEFDKLLDRYQFDLDQFPQQLKQFSNQLDELKQNLEEKKKSLISHQLKKKEEEVELGTCEEKMRKGEMELNTIKSNESYKIKLKENDQYKDLKSKVEDNILILMDEIDHISKELKNSEQENKTKEALILKEKNEKEDEIKKIQALQETELKKRLEYSAGLSSDLLSSYEMIRKKRKGPVLANIIGESCGGCNTMLTPGTINEVKKGKNLILCDSCSMILYLEEIPTST